MAEKQTAAKPTLDDVVKEVARGKSALSTSAFKEERISDNELQYIKALESEFRKAQLALNVAMNVIALRFQQYEGEEITLRPDGVIVRGARPEQPGNEHAPASEPGETKS